jgi:hypothetical protein
VTLARAARAWYERSLRDMLPLRVKLEGRRVLTGVARRVGFPLSSSRLPRPERRRWAPPLRVERALVACDLNPRYLRSWALVRRAWREVANLEPMLVLVAAGNAVPAELSDDPAVRVFEPLPGIPTPLQAQCIRLLYPALLEGPGAVLISDVELVPLDPSFFHSTIAGIDDRAFVAYRGDVLQPRPEIAIAYNAARPETWAEIFGVASVEDVRRILATWGHGLEYDGERGGRGWFTDQLVLHRFLLPWAERTRRLWAFDDEFTRHTRLERDAVPAAPPLPDGVAASLRARRYSDYHSRIPHDEFREANEQVLELALQALRPS